MSSRLTGSGELRPVPVAGWIVHRMAAASGPADTTPDALGYGVALSMGGG